MVKAFQADGMPLWAIKTYSFTTQDGVGTYEIGVGKTLNTPMPLKIIQALRQTSNSTPAIPMNIYADYNFRLLPNTAPTSIPVNMSYQPLAEYGVIQLWPAPQAGITISLRYQRPFEDMVGASDDFDFPSYWTEALIYGLADRLAPEYGIPLQDRMLIKKEAEFHKETALSFGSEESSVQLMPDWSGR